MFDQIRHWVLRVMRVPHDPTPPFGVPGSVRIFRAGRNYYNLRLARWGIGQVVGVIGICFSILFLNWLDAGAPRFSAMLAEQKPVKAAPASAGAAAAPAGTAPVPVATATAPTPAAPVVATERIPEGKRPVSKAKADAQKKILARIASQSPRVLPWLHFFEYVAILGFIVQLPVSYAAVRLNFEQHWYIVTDRSLRIRTGLWSLQESTMSFANLQQVEMKQGPLQRLLGLGDVHVQSAGGGGDYNPHHAQGDSLHTGVFHSVDNATEIRDLILARLRSFRQAGLGDHDDPHDHAVAGDVPAGATTEPGGAAVSNTDALAAVREILTEARALRQALS